MAKNKFEALKEHTVIVSDTGDIEAVRKYMPQDGTTNPSLLFKAASMPEYKDLVTDAVEWAKMHTKSGESVIDKTIVKLFVNFGVEILKIVPGRVSTEVDARLSFDTEGSVKRAREYIALYEESGVSKDRILVKLASTWEGIKAAEILEKQGIHCNMTLMFSMAQAIGAAEAKATLISPFVGRIYDWQKKKEGKEIPAKEDMGVQSVGSIYHYYKKFGYKTQIMGASFRNLDEILELAGCDLLTISPNFLEDLKQTTGDVPRKLNPADSKNLEISKISVDEKTFRLMLCNDEMATEKLYDGIRGFIKDTIKLEEFICKTYNMSDCNRLGKAM
ncbi:MAG: transaldolase [Chlamydiae bacterium]|nr:transaldolase [Chlamydiota bacterium]